MPIPSRPEPLLQGLALAQRLNDVAGDPVGLRRHSVAGLDRRAPGDRREGLSHRQGDV